MVNIDQKIDELSRKTQFLTTNSEQLVETVKHYEDLLNTQVKNFSEFRKSESESRIESEQRHGVTLKRMYDEL